MKFENIKPSYNFVCSLCKGNNTVGDYLVAGHGKHSLLNIEQKDCKEQLESVIKIGNYLICSACLRNIIEEHYTFEEIVQIFRDWNGYLAAEDYENWLDTQSNTPSKKDKPSGYVYCLKDSHNFYKIGKTNNWNKRKKCYIAENSQPFTEIVVELVEDYSGVEKHLVQYFSQKKLDVPHNKEWFKLDESDVSYVKNYLIQNKYE
jgi:hypothetical protein